LFTEEDHPIQALALIDKDEHVVGHEPAVRGDRDGEQVGGRNAFPMGGQKRAPRRSLTSLGRGLDAELS
jgi:hypothetical protein